MKKEQYQMALNTLFMISSEHLGFELNYEKNLMQELIDERPRLIKALKDIDELLKRLTLEQKKPLGATTYTIQGIIIEILEREGR